MSDTPTLIEAIAMAICAANGCEDDLLPEPYQTDATWHNYVDEARVALSAIEQAGFVLMPVEPTNEMLAEGRCFAVPATQSISAIYDALLSARPRVT